VRELRPRDDVADGVHAGHGGPQPLVRDDETALQLHADALETEPAGHGCPAHGDEQQLGRDRVAVLEGDRHPVVRLLGAAEPLAQPEVDLPAPERPLEPLADRLVLERQQVRQRLDDGDLCAEGAPQARELDADDAAAENDHRRGDALEPQCLIARDDAPAELEPGQRARSGARREHHVGALIDVVADGDGGGGDEAPLTLDHRDAAIADEPLQPLVLLRHDAVAVGREPLGVDALEADEDAVLLGGARRVRHLGAVQQRLGRNAAAVQAGAADLVLLDQGDARAELCGAQRCCVTPAATAENDEVEGVICHSADPTPRLQRGPRGVPRGAPAAAPRRRCRPCR
jgi:hypothetical protein